MDKRSLCFCISWFSVVGLINFLCALLIAWKTITANCEEEVCNFHGECLTNEISYTCKCHDGYFGQQCQFEIVSKDSAIIILKPLLNTSSSVGKGKDYMHLDVNATAAAAMTTMTTSTIEHGSEIDPLRQGLTPTLWTFIIVFTVLSNFLCIFAFCLYNVIVRKFPNRKDYIGVKMSQTEADYDDFDYTA